MAPFIITAMEPFARWLGSGWIAFEPTVETVVIELLAPQQSGVRLADDVLVVHNLSFGNNRAIKLIRFIASLRDLLIKRVFQGLRI